MKNIKTKFAVIFLGVLLCVPAVIVRADDTIVTSTPDTTPPVITLLGDATVSIPVGTSYTDAGATATDAVDGDITSKIVVTDPVDTTTPGTYTVTYTVSDSAGNAATPVTRTVTVVAPIPVPTETVLIRDGSTVIYQGTVNLPATGIVSITDDTGTTHSVNADSFLGLLYSISQTSGSFSLSDIQYYSSFGSLYLKCLTPSGGVQACDNWQYVVNDSAPSAGMDSTILLGGETVGLYFGSPHQVTFNITSITAGGSFTATAQQYNYLDNTWGSLTGVTIGATVPNPNDPYNPTVVTSQAVDVNGNATLTLATAGTYTVGIADDYYFPSYTVTVSAPVQSGGGGSGGDIPPPPPIFSVPNAIAYLMSVQSPDGSFNESDMYTDWAAIAFGADNISGTAETNLLNYMSSHNTVSSLLTDNERHAMALLALGQNPYSFHGVDYITPIINSFDGTQFGDPTLDNDDIFALIPLESAGYTVNDSIIAKDIAFVISKQNADGSWDETPDMTAAAIQALKPVSSARGVSVALTKATTYLQNTQASDGGFGSIYSTSWVAQAMSTLDASWTKNGISIADYLASQQANDGAALPTSETLQNRIWATSYAIPAALALPWSSIMHSVSKPVQQVVSSSGGGIVIQKTTPPPIILVPPEKTDPIIAPVVSSPIVPVVVSPVVSIQKPKQKSVLIENTSALKKKETSTTEVPLISKDMPTSSSLSAVAVKSGGSLPLPLVAGAVISVFGLAFLARRFIVKP